MVLGAKAGIDVVVASPASLQPAVAAVELATAGAEGSGRATVTEDPVAAAAGAHAIYADVWVSMGDDPTAAASRRVALEPYRLDDALLDAARDDAIALHCLPAHPGEEITAERPLRPALRGLGPGREPAARPEGAARAAARVI